MIENLDFSDSKKARKTLLILSFIGIFFKSLQKYSTGKIEFLGFKIPVEDASVIPEFIGYIIIYFIIVLIIRYNYETYEDLYKRNLEFLNKSENEKDEHTKNFVQNMEELNTNPIRLWLIKFGTKLIDIIFPVSFGIISIIIIFK